MTLYIPPSLRVTDVVLLIATDLNLLETPSRQDLVTRTEIASELNVSEPQLGGKAPDFADSFFFPEYKVIDDFDHPVISEVACRGIPVA